MFLFHELISLLAFTRTRTRTRAEDPLGLIDAIHARKMQAGVAISPDTPSTAITDEVAEAADMLLVMTVYPGAFSKTNSFVHIPHSFHSPVYHTPHFLISRPFPYVLHLSRDLPCIRLTGIELTYTTSSPSSYPYTHTGRGGHVTHRGGLVGGGNQTPPAMPNMMGSMNMGNMGAMGLNPMAAMGMGNMGMAAAMAGMAGMGAMGGGNFMGGGGRGGFVGGRGGMLPQGPRGGGMMGGGGRGGMMGGMGTNF